MGLTPLVACAGLLDIHEPELEGSGAVPTDAQAPPAGGDGDPSSPDGGNGGFDSGDVRRVFVTPDAFNATFGTVNGGIATGDIQCMKAAASRYPNRTFVAWLSDRNANAIDRVGDGPWFLPDGTPFADRTTLVVPPLGHPLDQRPDGAPVARDSDGGSVAVYAWTGTSSAGTAAYEGSCSGWSSNDIKDNGVVGSTAAVDGAWSQTGANPRCNSLQRLYCFER